MKPLGDLIADWILTGEQPPEQDVQGIRWLLNTMQLNNFPAQNWPTLGRVDFNDITANTASKSSQTDTNNPTGFADKTKSTLSLSTRTLTIAPTSASYDIYSSGTKITKTASDSTTIANTVGLHYVYFTSEGVLSNSMTAWDIEGTGIPVCTIYWNGSAGAIGEERHSAKRNNSWHKWAHDTIGTRYESGLGITYPSGAQPARTQIESGYIHDEDLDISISQQKLVRIFYETASATWTWVNGTDNSGYDRPYLWNAGTSRLRYPKSDSSYTLTDVDANKYIVMWMYASSDVDRPIYIVVKSATAPYNSAALARLETSPIVINVLAPEMKLIYRLIYAGDGTHAEYSDYRTASPLPGGSVGTVPATQISFAPTTDISATNVQTAIEEVYSEAAGLNPIGIEQITNPVTWASSTAENTLYSKSVTIPMYVNPNNVILHFNSIVELYNNSGGNVVYTFKFKYGTTVLQFYSTTVGSSGYNYLTKIEGWVCGNGATNAQVVYAQKFNASAWSTYEVDPTYNPSGVSTQDSTGAISVVLTCTMDTSHANAKNILRFARLEKFLTG